MNNITDKDYLESVGLAKFLEYTVIRDKNNKILGVMDISGKNECLNGKLLKINFSDRDGYKRVDFQVIE